MLRCWRLVECVTSLGIALGMAVWVSTARISVRAFGGGGGHSLRPLSASRAVDAVDDGLGFDGTLWLSRGRGLRCSHGGRRGRGFAGGADQRRAGVRRVARIAGCISSVGGAIRGFQVQVQVGMVGAGWTAAVRGLHDRVGDDAALVAVVVLDLRRLRIHAPLVLRHLFRRASAWRWAGRDCFHSALARPSGPSGRQSWAWGKRRRRVWPLSEPRLAMKIGAGERRATGGRGRGCFVFFHSLFWRWHVSDGGSVGALSSRGGSEQTG